MGVAVRSTSHVLGHRLFAAAIRSEREGGRRGELDRADARLVLAPLAGQSVVQGFVSSHVGQLTVMLMIQPRVECVAGGENAGELAGLGAGCQRFVREPVRGPGRNTGIARSIGGRTLMVSGTGELRAGRQVTRPWHFGDIYVIRPHNNLQDHSHVKIHSFFGKLRWHLTRRSRRVGRAPPGRHSRAIGNAGSGPSCPGSPGAEGLRRHGRVADLPSAGRGDRPEVRRLVRPELPGRVGGPGGATRLRRPRSGRKSRPSSPVGPRALACGRENWCSRPPRAHPRRPAGPRRHEQPPRQPAAPQAWPRTNLGEGAGANAPHNRGPARRAKIRTVICW